jgi:type I restriction enzyme S subunit
MNPYPKQLLGAVLKRSQLPVAIDPLRTYNQVKVRLYHKGVDLRGEKSGSAIRSTRQWLVRQGQILLSRIDARNGAIGLVPVQLEGAIVTNDFWAFDVNLALAVPQFLDHYFATPEFVETCNASSEGTTNRVRLQPDRFLRIEVPLPPLAEQRRIVSRIERLSAEVEKARRERIEAVRIREAVMESCLNALFGRLRSDGKEFKSLGSLTIYCRYGPRFYNEQYSDDGVRIMRATDIDASGKINYLSMPKMAVSDVERHKLILKPGDLVVVRSGSVGLAAVFEREDVDCIPAAYLIQFRFDPTIIPNFVRYCLRAPNARKELIGRGTALKNVNADKIKAVQIPILSRSDQAEIVSRLDRLQTTVDAIESLQSDTSSELSALMPSILSRAFRGEL